MIRTLNLTIKSLVLVLHFRCLPLTIGVVQDVGEKVVTHWDLRESLG